MANFVIEDIKRAFKEGNHLVQIIIVNVAIFLFQSLVDLFGGASGYFLSLVIRYIGIPADPVDSLIHFWTFLTYLFFHGGVFHLMFNMLWLYWIGRLFIALYTQARFIKLFFFGGVFAGVFFVLIATVFQSIGSSLIPVGIPLIGASGAVMAIIIASATLQPNYEISFFLIDQIKLKYIALAAFLLTVFIDFYINTGGKMAHFGGAIFGYLYGYFFNRGRDILAFSFGFPKKLKIWNVLTGKKKMRIVYSKNNGTSNATKTDKKQLSKREVERKTDEILDKISKSGYDSLTKEEKEFLFKVSKQ